MNTLTQTPKRISLEETINLLQDKKAELMVEFQPPQLRIIADNMAEIYRLDYTHRPIMYELYLTYKIK